MKVRDRMKPTSIQQYLDVLTEGPLTSLAVATKLGITMSHAEADLKILCGDLKMVEEDDGFYQVKRNTDHV